MKKNLLSRFKKSAVTMIVKGISEYENDKVIKNSEALGDMNGFT